MPLRQAVELVRKLAEALAYAHKNGVVHRDVKPGNVMLRDDGEPLLMDFGLATRADEERMTLDGQRLGTPAYMAPEQWQGKAEAASDQYSLGCLLFELLTGRPPFAGGGGGVEHYLFLHLHQPAPSPRALRRELPRDLETIVLKCLEKGPARRYAGCQALADDLRRCLEGEPLQARRVGAAERTWRWARRSPAVAALTAAVVLALAAGAGVSTALAFRAGERADEADRERDAARAAESNAQKQEKRADDLSHALLLDQAARALVDHRDAAQAGELLGRCPAGLEKTWEHRHVLGLYRRLAPLTLKGHAGRVSSVAFSADGRRIASGSMDGTVKVWDVATGHDKLTLKGHTDMVTSVAFSADGWRIVSGSWDSTVKVWDAPEPKAR
jgi:hypothetical protein